MDKRNSSFIKYPSINGLRGLCLVFMLTNHFSFHFQIFKPIAGNRWLETITNFLQDGHLAVNVFFIISGFLITVLMLHEEENTQSFSLKNFYIRRILRIFPAFYFLLLVYFIFQSLGYLNIPQMAWISALTYTKYFNWELDWYTAHAWTLSIEEHFYLLWPLVFLAGKKFRKIIPIALIILVPFVRTYLYFYPSNWMNDATIFTRIDAVATGCIFALYKDKILLLISPHWKKIFYTSCFILFFLRYFPNYFKFIHLDFIFIPLGLTHGSIANFLIALIMMYSVFGPRGLWFKFLNNNLLNFFGILSYSIYLWQQPFTCKTEYWINQFPQNIFLILACALFSYYIIEKPFLRLKTKFKS